MPNYREKDRVLFLLFDALMFTILFTSVFTTNLVTLPFFVASTEEELRKTRKERDDIRREKDEIIAELQFKIDHMESAYENVLHVCTTNFLVSLNSNVSVF